LLQVARSSFLPDYVVPESELTMCKFSATCDCGSDGIILVLFCFGWKVCLCAEVHPIWVAKMEGEVKKINSGRWFRSDRTRLLDVQLCCQM
jgi:hypothetical protein